MIRRIRAGKVRWDEAPIRVEAGVVEYEVERAIAERTAGRVQIELFENLRNFVHGFAILGVEVQRVETKAVRRTLQLCHDILVGEKMNIGHWSCLAVRPTLCGGRDEPKPGTSTS